MEKEVLQVPVIKLVGLSMRTSNQREMQPETAQIGPTMQRFFGEGIPEKIQKRKNPGRVFAVYTDYQDREYADYTYFLGEEVLDFEQIPASLQTLTIPLQTYVRLTSEPGKMPTVVIDLWKYIWQMDAVELGGRRAYVADFEVYDERSRDPHAAVVEVYLGLQGAPV